MATCGRQFFPTRQLTRSAYTNSQDHPANAYDCIPVTDKARMHENKDSMAASNAHVVLLLPKAHAGINEPSTVNARVTSALLSTAGMRPNRDTRSN